MKSHSYSRQRQLREADKAAVSNSTRKEVQPEKKGGRKPTDAAAPSSQLGEMKWHDFQKAECRNEEEDLYRFRLNTSYVLAFIFPILAYLVGSVTSAPIYIRIIVFVFFTFFFFVFVENIHALKMRSYK